MLAEQNVVGAVLLRPEAYFQVSDLLTVEDFTDERHAAMWRVFGQLHDAERPIDVFTVPESLGWDHGDAGYVITLASNTASAANIRAYAESVKAATTARRLRIAGQRIAAQGDLPEAQRLLAEIMDSQPGRLISAKAAAKDMYDNLLIRYEAKGDLSGLETGIPQLDALTGGLQPGRVYALGARAKMGKSILAWQIAAHVAVRLGRKVVGYSLEMGTDELMQRMACGLAQVRSGGLLHPRLMSDFEWGCLNNAITEITAAPLWLSERMDVTIDQIEAQCRQSRPALVVIDYLQLIEQPKLETEAVRLAYITRRIKKLAKDCAVPVIEVFQVNRGNEQGAVRPPRPSDARGSGTIEQDCDAMLLLHRPNYYDKAKPKGLQLDLALQRNGPTGMVLMDDDLGRCRFVPTDRQWAEPQQGQDNDL